MSKLTKKEARRHAEMLAPKVAYKRMDGTLLFSWHGIQLTADDEAELVRKVADALYERGVAHAQ